MFELQFICTAALDSIYQTSLSHSSGGYSEQGGRVVMSVFPQSFLFMYYCSLAMAQHCCNFYLFYLILSLTNNFTFLFRCIFFPLPMAWRSSFIFKIMCAQNLSTLGTACTPTTILKQPVLHQDKPPRMNIKICHWSSLLWTFVTNYIFD